MSIPIIGTKKIKDTEDRLQTLEKQLVLVLFILRGQQDFMERVVTKFPDLLPKEMTNEEKEEISEES